MYNTNIKSRLGKPKVNVIRSQNGLSGRIGKKNLQGRLGTNLGNKAIGNPIKRQQAGRKVQGLNISGTDIRNKIIAKKRLNITDARDRLAQIDKFDDARVKLNKIKTHQPSKIHNSSLQVTPKGVIQKTVQNVARRNVMSGNPNQNKQNGVSNVFRTGLDGKTLMKAGALIRTVNGNSRPFPASSRPLLNESNATRLASSAANDSDRYHPLRNNPNVVTIKNENASRSLHQNRSSIPQMRVNQDLPDYGQQIQSQVQQPILTAPLYGNYGGPVWVPQPMHMQEEIRPTQLRITTPNNYMDYYQAPPQRYEEQIAPSYRPVPSRPMAPKRSLGYDAYEEYTPSPPKKQELSSEIISRLDRPQRAIANNGFKIVVTNLHHVVTLEDVQELFGNIGPIKSARIVRDGVAEIFFVHEESAYRSVEVYHNRQLDGLPMNVTLVSRKHDVPSRQLGLSRKEATPPNAYRSIPSLRASPPRRAQPSFHVAAANRMTKSVLRAAGGGSSIHDSTQFYNKRSHNLDVAPDISTIHQALFCGKGNAPLSNQQFYVKLPKPTFRGMK